MLATWKCYIVWLLNCAYRERKLGGVVKEREREREREREKEREMNPVLMTSISSSTHG